MCITKGHDCYNKQATKDETTTTNKCMKNSIQRKEAKRNGKIQSSSENSEEFWRFPSSFGIFTGYSLIFAMFIVIYWCIPLNESSMVFYFCLNKIQWKYEKKTKNNLKPWKHFESIENSKLCEVILYL